MPVRKNFTVTVTVTATAGQRGRLVVDLPRRAQDACSVAVVRNAVAAQALAAVG